MPSRAVPQLPDVPQHVHEVYACGLNRGGRTPIELFVDGVGCWEPQLTQTLELRV